MVRKTVSSKQDNLTTVGAFQRGGLGKQRHETVCLVTAKPYWDRCPSHSMWPSSDLHGCVAVSAACAISGLGAACFTLHSLPLSLSLTLEERITRGDPQTRSPNGVKSPSETRENCRLHGSMRTKCCCLLCSSFHLYTLYFLLTPSLIVPSHLSPSPSWLSDLLLCTPKPVQ